MGISYCDPLLLRRTDHQAAAGRANDRNQHSKAQRPAKAPIGKSLTEQRNQDPDTCQPQDADRESHQAPQSSIQRRTDVEVTGCASSSLEVNDANLEN